MSKRRSLDDALTPEEQAFLESKPVPEESPQPQKENPPMSEPALKQEHIPESDAMEQPAITSSESLNTRIESAISTALLRASMERKIRRQPKSSKAEIVGEALAAWLTAHGYLK